MAENTLTTLQGLPHADLIPAVLLLLVGLMLWAAGRRVLRASFAAIGFVIGAVVGWILISRIAPDISPFIGGGVLGLAVACFAAIVSRAAVSIALAVVLAIGAPLGVGAAHELRGDGSSDAAVTTETAGEENSESPSGSDPASDWLNPGAATDATTRHLATEAGLDEQTTEQIEIARDHMAELFEAIQARWAATPETLRPLLIGAAIAGFLIGILLGALAPNLATAIVTACGGALLWLTMSRILLLQLAPDIADKLPESPTRHLAFWGIASLIGVVIQWRLKPHSADDSG